MTAQITTQLVVTLTLGAIGHFYGQHMMIATGFGMIAGLLTRR